MPTHPLTTRRTTRRTAGRAALAGLTLGVTALTAFALAAPAGASTASTASTATAAHAERSVHSAPAVSADAWSAGRAAHGASASAADAVSSYWTPARMKAAHVVEDSPTYTAAVSRYLAAQASSAASANAKTATTQTTSQPTTVGPAGGLLGLTARSGIRPAATYPGLPYYAPTARTSGKVFFTQNGVGYVCSATIVNSPGADTVWTAGHCVNPGSKGAWMTNWAFVPAYNGYASNPRPYGTWTANQLWTTGDWYNSSDFTADMGVAVMAPQFGYHIVNYLGGQGLRANAGKNVYENIFGYPSESPFNGASLYSCAGGTSPESSFLWWSSDTLKLSCNMTRGSSGGGWLNGWDGNWGYLNGVNSRIDRIVNPTIMLSPYFDDTALSLYNTTKNL